MDPVLLDLELISGVRIAFYFYYEHDFGFGGHPCDLESIEMTVNVEAVDRVGFVGRLVRAVGAAHGVGWYSNILDITADVTDVRLPLTVLVEENKHASCPDRNGDGNYSPGYDVNRRINDAWGVRDDMGAGVLSNARYSPAMTKRRRPRGRVFPPGLKAAAVELGAEIYELRRDISITEGLGTCGVSECTGSFKLHTKLRSERFGKGPKRDRDAKNGFAARQSRYHPAEMWGSYRGDSYLDHIQISYRNDQAQGVTVGFALQSPLPTGWLVPKVNLFTKGQWGFDVLYSPSASRVFDWYAGVGFEHAGAVSALDAFDGQRSVQLATELGFRFRFLKGVFWGGRLGVRTTGRDLHNPRLVFEAGLGSF